MRRQFPLPPEDEAFLNENGYQWETIIDGSHWVLLHNFSTQHPGYQPRNVTAAVRIETGYPNAPLNMVYFNPPVVRADGVRIGATEAQQQIDGKMYQRWSRHYTAAHPWVIGESDLESHLITVEEWLLREFEKVPSQCNN